MVFPLVGSFPLEGCVLGSSELGSRRWIGGSLWAVSRYSGIDKRLGLVG